MARVEARSTPAAVAGYVHGPAAATDGLPLALRRTPDPTVMIFVEGVSDQIAVETLATRRGRDLLTERVAVVPIGGAGAIRRVLAEHAAPGARLTALCDVGEEAQVRRGIEPSGLDVSVHVCVADLEDELIRAVGVDGVVAVLDRAGRSPRRSPRSASRSSGGVEPMDARLHRFLAAGARRKLRYARLLTDAAFDLDRVPRPLVDLLDVTASDDVRATRRT